MEAGREEAPPREKKRTMKSNGRETKRRRYRRDQRAWPRDAAEEGSAGRRAETLKEERGREVGEGGLVWFWGTRVSRSSSSSETEGSRSMAAEGNPGSVGWGSEWRGGRRDRVR